MKAKILLLAGMMMCVGVAMPQTTLAQDDEDEGPGTRVITVTTWNVPFGERGPFFQFFGDRILPSSQLNPNVINTRLMGHQWGSNASQIVLVNEYADMAAVAADCGQPCSDYFEANPAPEEGDEGYEEYQEGLEAFQKYYSHHSDEIFTTWMIAAKVEGELMGPVGIPDDEDEGDGDD